MNNYLIIFILLAGGLLFVVLLLCKAAADADQVINDIFKEFFSSKENEKIL